jgi:hypothetical protein
MFHLECYFTEWKNRIKYSKRQKYLEVNVVSGFWHPVFYYSNWEKLIIHPKRNASYFFRFSPFGTNGIGFQTPYVADIPPSPVRLHGVATLSSPV